VLLLLIQLFLSSPCLSHAQEEEEDQEDQEEDQEERKRRTAAGKDDDDGHYKCIRPRKSSS